MALGASGDGLILRESALIVLLAGRQTGSRGAYEKWSVHKRKSFSVFDRESHTKHKFRFSAGTWYRRLYFLLTSTREIFTGKNTALLILCRSSGGSLSLSH